MQPIIAIAAVTGLALLPVLAEPGPGPEIGKPAPALTLVDAQGKKHSLSDYKGKVVVLEWVNVTCPDARLDYQSGHTPTIQKAAKAKGVVWLSVIITEQQQSEDGQDVITPARADSMAHAMVEQYGATPTAMLFDLGGKVGATYDIRTSMHLFVVDKNGTLAYDGALDDRSVVNDFVNETYAKLFGVESGNAKSEKKRENREDYVATAVDQLLAGKPVTTTKTMPYGCHLVGHYLNDGGTKAHAGAGR